MTIDKTPTDLITIRNVCKSFKRDSSSQDMLVLDSIHFRMQPGEIVTLLGKSGSGKSTLLRIIAGLIAPSSGEVFYRGRPVTGPAKGIAMVFQNFALLPWLTVLENVELGLEAQGVGRAERRKRALAAIDTIGLDGFESAYPKELSGGMRQRVGFARALVVHPDILLMDEPFSALDVLTADTLRSDLLDLWQQKKTNTDGILFVTHNIEEAAYLADRIIIFDANPGRIHAELRANLPRPRNDSSPEFRQLVDRIYTLMTTRVRDTVTPTARAGGTIQAGEIGYRLPDVDAGELIGLLELINEPEYQGRMDLPVLADIWSLNIDDLFPITDVLQMLHFAKVSGGDIELTPAGKEFADAGILERKKIFRQHLLQYVPLAGYIRQSLDSHHAHRISKEDIVEELEEHLSEEESARVMRVIIDWGRYAEIFAYDDSDRTLNLENPH